MDRKAVYFSEFNPQSDNWDNYIERLKYCFEANGVTEDNAKRANFFTVCGVQVYETFLALITPRKSSDITFSEIESILTKHYSPKPNEISVSYKFYKCDQKANEAAADYIATLRKISSGCNFPNLERMLRDRLVCGMRNHRLQYELLKKDILSYSDVVDAMLSSENAERDAKMIQNNATGSHVTYQDTNSAVMLPPSSKPEPMDINTVQSTTTIRFCYRCGNKHSGECRFVNTICQYCHKKGHIEKVCISKKRNSKRINFTEDECIEINGIYSLGNLKSRSPPYEVKVILEGKEIVMQVDSGAGFSLLNEKTWRELRAAGVRASLRRAHNHLRTWTLTPVNLLGLTTVHVQFNNVKRYLDIFVARGTGPNLLGRDWFTLLNITISINNIELDDESLIADIIKKNSNVFKEGLGTYSGAPVKIQLKQDARPKFLKARPVPYAIKERVEKEINHLVEEGVLRPVPYSEWATPVVPIVKKTGEIRLCGDYRSTVNQATESDTYPMPTASEVFATVAGGKYFTTLDLDRAYTQVVVDDVTAKLLTLNTCQGLYSVHRLAFGVKACPGIFQRLMTSLLAGIHGVAVLIDDVIVSGTDLVEMSQRLNEVLQRIGRAGLRLNRSKCKFARKRVEFLGFVIDSEGIHPAPSKVESIIKTPPPKNIQELQAFLGLYNFYERFIPHKATILEPLHRLLDKSRTWQWSRQEQNSFDTAKRLLSSDMTLVHYDLEKPLILTCDSSEYGVGAVLSHVMEDGDERPIALSSRTLHSHERRYSQFDKEATAIMFGIQKFNNYIMGRHFTIVTDHKPLLGIFDPKKPMPNVLSPRLTRIAVVLTSHSYEILYRPGTKIGNADGLSRWPQPVPEQGDESKCDILLMAETPDDFPFDATQVENETRKDRVLSQVYRYVMSGWPTTVRDHDLRNYWLHRSELSVQDGCILLGCRVVIPPNLRSPILQALHKTHNGIVHTKSLARSYVWWPQLNKDIETLVGDCNNCLQNRHMPAKSSHEWITPTRPWSRLNIDFAGPYQGKYFLIVVDAFSRWPEIFVVNNMTSQTVIRHLRNLFATHGLCETLVSDNGPSFISDDFEKFLISNKIKHITTAPYHPATNGLAERMVQTVKDKLRKMINVTSWDVKIPNILLGLRVTPCSSTNKSPSELLMNRRLRTLLDALHPDVTKFRKTEQQIEQNTFRKHREIVVDQDVMYRNYTGGPSWIPGKVISKEGPSSYKISNDDGTIVKRHVDQIIKRNNNPTEVENNSDLRSKNEQERQRGTTYDQEDHDAMEEDSVIEIPSSEQWAEMLGIPNTSEVSFCGGKLRNRLNVHGKTPYAKSSTNKDFIS